MRGVGYECQHRESETVERDSQEDCSETVDSQELRLSRVSLNVNTERTLRDTLESFSWESKCQHRESETVERDSQGDCSETLDSQEFRLSRVNVNTERAETEPTESEALDSQEFRLSRVSLAPFLFQKLKAQNSKLPLETLEKDCLQSFSSVSRGSFELWALSFRKSSLSLETLEKDCRLVYILSLQTSLL